MAEFGVLDILFYDLDGAIIQIIEDTDGCIFVKEVVWHHVIEMIGEDIKSNRSVEAVQAFFHIFPLEIEDLRLLVGQL